MRSAERRKVNVLEMKCLRSLVGNCKNCKKGATTENQDSAVKYMG